MGHNLSSLYRSLSAPASGPVSAWLFPGADRLGKCRSFGRYLRM